MVDYLPMNREQVARAAETMIAQHGNSALAEVDEQIRTYRTQGFDAVAETWKLIRKAIQDAQGPDPAAEGYRKALRKGVLLSE